MPLLRNQKFVCIDCEATGLCPKNDAIIEVAVATFTLDAILESYETLVNPQCPIPVESIAIHHITEEMIQGKPSIEEILPEILSLIGSLPIIGHGIGFDIDLIQNAADKHNIPCTLSKNKRYDTLRLARYYGQSPTNSLEMLRKHFNIENEGAHRAMSDVLVNIQVFYRLVQDFKSTQDIEEVLNQPIQLKAMPLGKHKGRPLKDIPLAYLQWASRQEFDQDLLFSLRKEINRRKKGSLFEQANNPFACL